MYLAEKASSQEEYTFGRSDESVACQRQHFSSLCQSQRAKQPWIFFVFPSAKGRWAFAYRGESSRLVEDTDEARRFMSAGVLRTLSRSPEIP